MEVSIIIPIYNGSHLLERHLTPFLKYLQTKPFGIEVVLVDDGSDDATSTMRYAEEHKMSFISIGINKGKGNALRAGFNVAKGKIQIFTDVDIPFQYHNFDEFVELIKKDPNQLVIGDRSHPSSIYFEKSSPLRNLGSNLVAQLVNRFFIPGIKDTQCGLKGMSRSVANMLFSASVINRFAIDIELIYLAEKFGIPVVKYPVQLRYNDKSSVRVVRDGLKLLYDILRIRRIHNNKKSRHRSGDKISIRGNYQYEAYYNGKVPQRYWHKFKLDTTVQNLKIGEAKQMLDVGCGSGILSSIIAKANPRLHVIGLDGNPDAILFCRQQWQDLRNVDFKETKVDELDDFLDTSVDRIAFLEVIEHITSWQAQHVLKEFYRILKKDGILVISTPNRKSLWPFWEYILDLCKLTPKLKGEQHEVLYSGTELKSLAEKQGFCMSNQQTINFIAPWVSAISTNMAEKIHNWESRKKWIPGSLLLYTFIKRE